jgi:6-phosphogluconolactonase (cycloisomerase 2 family)
MPRTFRLLRSSLQRFSWLTAAGLALVLAGCGGGGGMSPTTYQVGGQVSGLTGAGLTLSLNGGAALAVSADGNFAFPTAVSGAFNVTVAAQPVGQTCTVSNGSGASAGANVSNVSVACATTTFTVGGAVSGLANGEQLTLLNNGADPLVVSADGGFTFATPVAYNGGYAITVDTQPIGKTCTVADASGAGVTANVSAPVVTCATSTYTVGGTVSGLAGGAQLTLQNNAGDATIVSANGSYSFATPVAHGGAYAVTVSTQPVGQTCTVSNGSGSNVSANVANANVSCSTNSYTIGGAVSGLPGGTQVTLRNNGGDALTVNANGAFTFATPVAHGGSYSVTVGTQPAGGTCTVSSGSGSNLSANVSSVSVSCTVPAITWFYVPDYGSNRVLGYSLNRTTGALGSIPGSPWAAGTDNRWVATNPARTFLYTSNQGTNTVSAYTVNASTGALTAVAGSPFATGTTPTSVEVSPNGKFAYVTNANGGSVSGYTIDQTTGALTPMPGSPFAAGNLPTKIAISPQSNFAYVVNQNDSLVQAFAIDPVTGALSPLAVPSYPMAGQGYGIAMHPSGNFLFAIGYQARVNVYRIDTSTGALTDLNPGGYTSANGSWGWQSMAFNSSGTAGYVATNMGVVRFTVDTTTGALTEQPGFALSGNMSNVVTNAAATRLFASDFIAINVQMANISPIDGSLSSGNGSPYYVGARPYNIVVIEP